MDSVWEITAAENCYWTVSTVQYSTVQYRQYSTVQYSTVQYSTVQYSTVQYSTVQYSTVQYSTVQYSTVQYSTVQYSTVQYSTVQCSTVQYSTVQYSTVQYSTVQYSTVQYSTVQYSTVQYSTVQYSTVQYCCWTISTITDPTTAIFSALGLEFRNQALALAMFVLSDHYRDCIGKFVSYKCENIKMWTKVDKVYFLFDQLKILKKYVCKIVKWVKHYLEKGTLGRKVMFLKQLLKYAGGKKTIIPGYIRFSGTINTSKVKTNEKIRWTVGIY